MLLKTMTTAKALTPEEKAWIYSLYPDCPLYGDQLSHKLVLNQLKHMPDKDVYMLCSWVDSLPFARIKQEKWQIERGYDTIELRADIHSYHIIVDTGNVHLYLDGRLTTEGNCGYAIQFYMKHFYAFPLFFEKGHWANGKNALQLGVAVPDMAPILTALRQLFDKDEDLVKEYLFDKKLHNIDYNNLEVFDRELTEIKIKLAHKS